MQHNWRACKRLYPLKRPVTVIHVDNHKVPSPPPSKVSDSDNTAITGASASIVPLLLWCSKHCVMTKGVYQPEACHFCRKAFIFSASKEEEVYIYRCVLGQSASLVKPVRGQKQKFHLCHTTGRGCECNTYLCGLLCS